MLQFPGFYLLLLVSLLTACSTATTKQPEWINDISTQYPATAYLLGRGQSDNRALAQDRARADLSKIFRLHITEQSEDVVSYTAQDQQVGKTESSASRYITTQTDQIVEGIRIAELWQDPANAQYHALAVLDRNQAANDLRQAIQDQDAATDYEINLARKQNELFNQIRHASRAVAIQYNRYENQRILKIIDPTGMGIPATHNLTRLRSQRYELLQRVKIELGILNDPIGGIEPILQGALAKAGFTHANKDNANYTLEADLQLDGFSDNKGWYWYRGSMQVNLLNNTAAKSQGSHRWDIKVAAQNPGTAAQRVRDQLTKQLDTELRDVIISFGAAE